MKIIFLILLTINFAYSDIIKLVLLDKIIINDTFSNVSAYLVNKSKKRNIILKGIYRMEFQSMTETVVIINWYVASLGNITKKINLRTALSTNENILSGSSIKAKGDISFIFFINDELANQGKNNQSYSNSETKIIKKLNGKISNLELELSKLSKLLKNNQNCNTNKDKNITMLAIKDNNILDVNITKDSNASKSISIDSNITILAIKDSNISNSTITKDSNITMLAIKNSAFKSKDIDLNSFSMNCKVNSKKGIYSYKYPFLESPKVSHLKYNADIKISFCDVYSWCLSNDIYFKKYLLRCDKKGFNNMFNYY